MSLYLLAHASTHAMRAGQFPDDDPLDRHGLAEAAALPHPWGAGADFTVLSSPMRCARETAAALGLRPDTDESLRDADYGDWRGRRLADLMLSAPEALARWMRDPDAAPHAGESFSRVLGRVAEWLDALAPDRDVIAVTHAAVVRAAIVHARGGSPADMLSLDIAPLAIVRARRLAGGWTLMEN